MGILSFNFYAFNTLLPGDEALNMFSVLNNCCRQNVTISLNPLAANILSPGIHFLYDHSHSFSLSLDVFAVMTKTAWLDR